MGFLQISMKVQLEGIRQWLSTNLNERATRTDQAVAFCYIYQCTLQLEGFNRQLLQAIPSLPTTCTMAKSAGRRPTAGLSAIQG